MILGFPYTLTETNFASQSKLKFEGVLKWNSRSRIAGRSG